MNSAAPLVQAEVITADGVRRTMYLRGFDQLLRQVQGMDVRELTSRVIDRREMRQGRERREGQPSGGSRRRASLRETHGGIRNTLGL